MNLGRAEKKFPTEEVMGSTPTCWASLQVHIVVTAILDLQSGLWLVVSLWDIVFKGQTLQTLQDTNFPFVVKKNLPIRIHHLSAVSGHSSYMWIRLFLFNHLQCSLSQSKWSVDLKHLRSPHPTLPYVWLKYTFLGLTPDLLNQNLVEADGAQGSAKFHKFSR